MQPGTDNKRPDHPPVDRGGRPAVAVCWCTRSRSRNVGFVLVLAMFLAVLPVNALGSDGPELPNAVDLLHKARQGGEYKSLTGEELATAEDLFDRMLKGERSQDLYSRWQNEGFTVTKALLQGREVLALAEKPDRKEGRGFYLFPLAASGSTVLMMPHSFYDLETLEIGQSLFAEGTFLAAAWNSVHRNRKPGMDRAPELGDTPYQWDLADLANTYFTALTNAFARTMPDGQLVQLHGFASEKRKSTAARDTDLILGNGTLFPPKDLISFGDCLKMNIPFMVRVYPLEIKDLGGMDNISAQILSQYGHTGFVQMEMSLPLRNQLSSSVQFRQAVINCMDRAWR